MPFPHFPVGLWGGADLMGFVHAGSIMMNRQSTGNYLSRAWGAGETPTSRKIGTWSGWGRMGEISALAINRGLFSGGTDGNNRTEISVGSSGSLQLSHVDAAAVTDQLVTTRVFRDPTAYYHILVRWDTTLATAADRIEFWINGVRVTDFSTENYPALNADFDFAYASNSTFIGRRVGTSDIWEGFLADYHYCDGQWVEPTEFGRFSEVHGEWIPKKVTGLTYGNSGFHLDFADPADLGNDVSGNANDFTAQGTFGAANGFIDVPAKTFPIGNSAANTGGADWSEACLTVTEASATRTSSYSTHVLPPGKWYWSQKPGNTNGVVGYMVNPEHESGFTVNGNLGLTARRGFAYNGTGVAAIDGVSQGTFGGWSANDVVTIWVDNTDPTSVKTWVDINDTQQGSGSPNPATGTDPLVTYTNSHPYPEIVTVVPGWSSDTGQSQKLDFGQRRGAESFIASALGDFKQINTQNFPVPSGPALFPDRYFDIVQWEGDGAASRTITGLKFQPDLVLLKNGDTITDWLMAINMADYSPSPSTPNNLRPNTTAVPVDNSTGNIEGFNADGFDVAAGVTSERDVNENLSTIQAWCWKSDPAAGFEIIRYTGDGVAGRTVDHNLGVVPELIIVKRLDGADNWVVYSNTYGRVLDPETDYVFLDLNNAAADLNTVWNDTAPTSSVFSLGTDTAVNGDTFEYVALVFASVPGFLKCQTYEGLSAANGAFVPTDFLPRVMYSKNWSAIANQNLMDPVLNGADNEQTAVLDIRDTAVLATYANRDVLANGWKLRVSNLATNTTTDWYSGFIYAKRASKFTRAQ